MPDNYSLSGFILIVFCLLCAAPAFGAAPSGYWGPWVTNTTTTTATISWWQESLGSDWTVAYATSSYYDAHGTFDHSVPDPDPDPANFHHILLTGLTPNTTYRYQVRVAGSDSPGNSQVFSVRKFQTFPVSGPFTFIVISDTHAQEQRFRYVADALANESGVLFILDGGDYASHDVESQWAYYYGYGDGMLANFTLYTSIGNHEYHNSTAVNVSTDAYEYRNSFVCPLYYSFDCAGVRFVILDSPDPANPNDENPTRAHSEAQASWLKDQLDNTQYGTFVIHHHPVWTVGHASSDSALQSWETLFHSYNISAHFAGHIHTYQRFSVEGIPYFVVANAGGGFVSLTGKPRPSSYVYGATKELGYLKVTVDPANNTATADEYFVASLPDYDSTTGTVISPPRLADTLTFPLKRNVPPPTPVLSAGFSVSPANGTAPQTVKCTDESIGGPTRYNYDFGDGVNVSGSNPGHTYRFPGTYTIKLTVTRYDAKTNSIASNSTTRVITVSRAPFTPPVAKFAASQTFGTVPLTVKFTDQSTGNPTFYTYDFGDGINMTGPNPVHTYRQPGNYTVTLTVMKKDPANGTMVSNSSVRKDFIVVQAK